LEFGPPKADGIAFSISQSPHSKISQYFLSLSLLKTGIFFVDHKQLALALHDLTIHTALFNRSSDFHCYCFTWFLLPAFSVSLSALGFKIIYT
jgi:hypothetical protein